MRHFSTLLLQSRPAHRAFVQRERMFAPAERPATVIIANETITALTVDCSNVPLLRFTYGAAVTIDRSVRHSGGGAHWRDRGRASTHRHFHAYGPGGRPVARCRPTLRHRRRIPLRPALCARIFSGRNRSGGDGFQRRVGLARARPVARPVVLCRRDLSASEMLLKELCARSATLEILSKSTCLCASPAPAPGVPQCICFRFSAYATAPS